MLYFIKGKPHFFPPVMVCCGCSKMVGVCAFPFYPRKSQISNPCKRAVFIPNVKSKGFLKKIESRSCIMYLEVIYDFPLGKETLAICWILQEHIFRIFSCWSQYETACNLNKLMVVSQRFSLLFCFLGQSKVKGAHFNSVLYDSD